jgi:hypothetical protein
MPQGCPTASAFMAAFMKRRRVSSRTKMSDSWCHGCRTATPVGVVDMSRNPERWEDVNRVETLQWKPKDDRDYCEGEANGPAG